MAESTSVALAAATIPSSAEIARAEKLVRERFLHEGEDPRSRSRPARRAAARSTARWRSSRQDPKAKHPSTAWRREFSLLLGLERLLSEEEPRLVDGTVLSAHQVDALSGTLTALLAEAQRAAPDGGAHAGSASPELLATADILGPDEAAQAARGRRERARAPRRGRRGGAGARGGRARRLRRGRRGPRTGPARGARGGGRGGRGRGGGRGGGELEEEIESEAESEEEPRDWVDEEDEDEALGEQPEDPNAAKRFWFEHATGAGKTVAALGLRGGFADRRRADPHPSPQPRRPVQRRAARPRLLQAHQPPAAEGRGHRQGGGRGR